MKLDPRLAICAVASVITHAAIARALDTLPPRNDHLEHKIDVRVITPPPPEPEKPPEEKPPEPPKPQPLERPKAPRQPAISTASVAKDSLSDRPAVVADTTETPVYGWTMASTSTAGTGAIPVGNTANPAAQGSGASTKRLAEPVAAYEATKMPLPQGRCSGKYTEEARTAGIEGTVMLDLIVGADGRVADITVVTGLAHGLDQAAIQALRDCRFTPGEKDGKPVPVRIRGFKIKFVLAEAE